MATPRRAGTRGRRPDRPRPDTAQLAESLLGVTITALVRGVRDPSRVTLKADRRSLCTLDEVTVVRLAIRKGAEIDADLASALAHASERDRLRAAALRRVARSMCSARQLHDALVRRGAAKSDAAALVAEFERLGLIDDAAFAEAKARSLAASGRSGPRLIESKLRAAGIAPERARAAALKFGGLRDTNEDARRLAERRARSMKQDLDPQTVRRRLFGTLARRGFDAEAARRAVEHVVPRGR